MNKLPWFPFYGRDFYLDEKVRLLSLRQEAIYLRLLWLQWEEGSIPKVESCQLFPEFRVTMLDDRFSENAQGDLDAEVEHVHLSCFQAHPTLPDRFQNPRLEIIRSEQIERATKIHERASKGGKALAKLRQSLCTTQEDLKHGISNAIQSQKQIKKKDYPEKSVSPHRIGDYGEDGFSQVGTALKKILPATEPEPDLVIQPESGP